MQAGVVQCVGKDIGICSLIVEIQICSSAPELSQNRNAQLPCLAKVEIATVQNLSLFLEPQRAFCAFCGDRIWGLGRQGFKCINCKMLIHKKCHKLCRVPCDVSLVCITKYKIEALKQNIHLLLKLEMYFIKDVNYELKPSLDINANLPVSRPAA